MEAKHESGLVVTLDFETIEDSIDEEYPIYIYKDEGLVENNIVLSVEETNWLIKELERLVGALEGYGK